MDEMNPMYDSSAKVVDENDYEKETEAKYYEPTERDEDLLEFVVEHTDRWRDYRNQNFLDDWERYERIFRGQWAAEDKQRDSERSRVISPATQQAVETRHAEIMEAIFGQGEYFDIKDDDQQRIDVEQLKRNLYDDFAKDKIRKAVDQIELMAEIYGTGIGEVVVGSEKVYAPAQQQVTSTQVAYGVQEGERMYVRLNPVNPKNFLFDPNGTSIDDCMGVAIEKYVSMHKIVAGIASGKYLTVDINSFYEKDELEATQETIQYQDDKVLLMTYYGLVPREYLATEKVSEVEYNDEMDDYQDMVEAVIIIANGNILLKAEESPYMMKDRPVVAYQDDTVPNRLLGRGTVEKAYNMQCAIDAQMRSHLDALALTVAPMMAVDATRLPRGAKFEVKPGKAFMTNGNPNEILFPFKFGSNDGAAMQTSKEFERMLLMATGTLDSQGMVTQGSRDAGGLAPAVAGIIKKYKRTLVNFQEDFLIPFINKAAWRYMQFAPERYPSVDVSFMPTASLGIMAREYEQQQLAFLVQTLGANSPLTPVLMQGIVANSSLSNREEILQQLTQASQPNPQAQQMQMVDAQTNMQIKQAQAAELMAKAENYRAMAQKALTEAQIAPNKAQADIMAAMSKNLPDNDAMAQAEFDRRAKLAELMIKEEDMRSNERIAAMQVASKQSGMAQ